mgnify:FL=1
MVFLIYLISYWGARGVLRGSRISGLVVMGKYLVYWAVITLGFKAFPMMAVLVGFTAGLYLSFPVLYWINKKYH